MIGASLNENWTESDMDKQRVHVVSAKKLLKMKRIAQARDRAIVAAASAEELAKGGMFLIRPEDARNAKIEWPAGRLK